MLLFFLIMSTILSVCLFFIEIYYNKLTITTAFLKMIGFLIISVGLSFLINHYLNPSTSYKPPKDSDKNNKNNDDKSIEPNLLKELQKSAIETSNELNNAYNSEINFFTANKNMFGFVDIFKQLFKKNN